MSKEADKVFIDEQWLILFLIETELIDEGNMELLISNFLFVVFKRNTHKIDQHTEQLNELSIGLIQYFESICSTIDLNQ